MCRSGSGLDRVVFLLLLLLFGRGQDSQGFSYVHFPAVSGSDIRVYRHKPWELSADPIWAGVVDERDRLERLRQQQLQASLFYPFYLSIHLPIYPSISLFISIHPSIHPSISLSIYLSYLSIFLPIYLFSLSICLAIKLSTYLYTHVS